MEQSNTTSKRINVVHLEMVRDKSITFTPRQLTNPLDVATLARKFIGNSDREQVLLICVNCRQEPTHIEVVSIGTSDKSLLNPKEVFKLAILSNASAIYLIHNHPSGSLLPSQPDLVVTENIRLVGKVLGIKLLDHIIINDNPCEYWSALESNTLSLD